MDRRGTAGGDVVANPTEVRPSEETKAGPGGYPGPWTGYGASPREMPLTGYAALLAAYAGLFGTAVSVAASRRGLPERIAAGDVLLFGVATHKIGRIVTRDWVTSPVRAPFTEYQASVGGGEVTERSRGEGLPRAIGDLLTCPWCIAPWVAGTLYTMFLVKPAAARLVAAAFSSVALSDVLQHAYSALRTLPRK